MVAHQKPNVNWPKIRNQYIAEYLTNKISLTALAGRHDVSRQAISKKAARECWDTSALSPVRHQKDSILVRERVLDLARLNLSKRSIAKSVGIDRATLDYWIDKDEEFGNQYHQCKVEIVEDSHRAIRSAIQGGDTQNAWRVLESHVDTKSEFGNQLKDTTPRIEISVSIPRPGEVDFPSLIDVTPDEEN